MTEPETIPDGPVAEFIIGLMQLVEQKPPQTWQEFQEGVGGILAQRPTVPVPGANTPEDAAEALVLQADDADEDAAGLAIEALRHDLTCVDAWVILGDECGDEWELAVLLYTFGVMVGRERLGDRFEELTGQFFVEPETVPFMRALEGLAQACVMLGDLETASTHYGTMLELNPADHQGARYPLLATLLTAKEPDAALGLLDIYHEDDTAPWAWGRALAMYQKEGTTPAADQLLAAAQRTNPDIAAFLTGNRRLQLEELKPGDEEAATVAMLFGPAWEVTVGAREWLMRRTGLAAAPPAKAKREGPRSID